MKSLIPIASVSAFVIIIMMFALASHPSSERNEDDGPTRVSTYQGESADLQSDDVEALSCDPPKVLCQSPKCTNGMFKANCCHPEQKCKAGCTENGYPYADCI